MLWLIITILAYLILAIVFLIDKYLLTGPMPDPKVYTFYIGFLGILILFLVPWVGFSMPGLFQIFLSLISGAIFIYAIFWWNKALRLFEASRVVPAVGGMVPLFTFLLIYIFSKGEEVLNFSEFVAFLLLLLGSVLITFKKEKFFTMKTLQISVLAAFLFSLSLVLTKYVYLAQPFWSGYILIKMGGFLMALGFLLFSKEVKEEILGKKISMSAKITGVFLFNQAMGAGANLLQNWAVALAPLVYIPIINALAGIQYAFLLIFTIFLSLRFPQILKEEISRKIIFHKIIAILIIGGGLILLSFK